MIQRSATIHREFIQQTLRGQDLDALCRVVSRRTQRPVAVIGPGGSDILADGGSPRETSYDYDIEDLLRNRGTLSQEPGAVSVPIHSLLDTGGPDYVLKVEIPTSNGPVTQVAAPVVIGTETVAYLVTWELGPPMSEFDLSVLAHACTAVGLVVLRRKAVMDAELQIQQGFYGAAISGEFKTVDEAASRAAGVGVTITSRYIVATVQSSRLKSTGDLKELRRWPGSVSVLAGNQHALLLHVPDHERRPESQARDLLQRLSERFTRPDAQSLIGQSRTVSSILELPAALLQARTALFTAEQLNISTPVVHYDDLGVYQLLGQIGDLPAVRAFTTEAIKQIRQARGGAELLRTLEAYLDAQGSHRAAASTLSIHPNTVKYRITRIREMLGDGIFDDPGKRLGVHLALKARHLQD